MTSLSESITLSNAEISLPPLVIASIRSGLYPLSYINCLDKSRSHCGILKRSCWHDRMSIEVLSPFAIESLEWLSNFSGDPDEQLYNVSFRNPSTGEHFRLKGASLKSICYNLQARERFKHHELMRALIHLFNQIRRGG